ncbi:MAG TPA: hypothetical protein VNZ52_00370 [Candidatus Thermoplasmatota archaeon]|nr:hypothetical protein [Candidatus Thermoplasmatota archaeon]
MRALPLVILALLLLPAVAPTAQAALPLKTPLTVTYTAHVRVDPGTPDRVQVAVTLTPAGTAFTRLELYAPATEGGSPALLRLEAPRNLGQGGGKWVLPGPFADTLHLNYTFNPRLSRGEGADLLVSDHFALLKLESLLPRFARVEYDTNGGLRDYGGRLHWDASVTFDLPPDWFVAGPYGPPGGQRIRIPDPVSGLPDISGYVVAGNLATTTFTHHGIRVDVVTAPGGRAWDDFEDYFQGAVPYLRATYGPRVGSHVLAIALPAPPMRRGGAALGNAAFWASEATPQVWAHEFTHLWQDWPTTETPGKSDVWLKEGGADWHGALSLLHAGTWTQARVDDFLTEKRRTLEREPSAQAPLSKAGYGSDHEGAAYVKGMHLLADMERSLVEAGNARGLLDLYRALHEVEANGQVLPVLWSFLGKAGWPGGLQARFNRAMNETGVSPAITWSERARPVILEPLLTPEKPTAGKPMVVRVPTINLGRSPGRIEGPLTWTGGPERADLGWVLQPREVREATLTVPAARLGLHHLETPAASIPFLVPAPPEVTVSDVSVSKPLREGEPFVVTVTVVNRGDAPAAFDFQVRYDDRVLVTQPWTLDARANHTFTYEAGTYRRGEHVLLVGDHEPVRLNVSAPAKIVVTRVEVSASRVQPGSPFEVRLTATNTGTEEGEDDLSFRIGREAFGPVNVRLKGGETRIVTFPVVVSGEGEHQIRVEGFSPITVTAEPALLTPGLGAVAAALAVGAALLVWRRR